MKAELISHMGTDLTVANAARVSFDKESEWVYCDGFEGQYCSDKCEVEEIECPTLSKKDRGLIIYLAKHNHFTPFTHCMITLRETVPIFVARQRFKHQIGFSYNEVSRRYVDSEPEFYTPDVWRKKADDKKQGSSDEWIHPSFLELEDGPYFSYEDVLDLCVEWYENALKKGLAPEQARMVLPQSMYTSYYVTGSLYAFARAYNLRSQPDAQKEIQDLAEQWHEILEPLYPHSWSALTSENS